MIASERSRHIISRLHESGIVNLKYIAEELNVSEATIRRDFEKLESDGILKRVAGGAVLTEKEECRECQYGLKAFPNYELKRSVAERACREIKDGQCIFVDGGSSAAALAPFLENRRITIVTNSGLFIHSLKAHIPDIVFTGGTYLLDYNISVGNLSQQALRQFHFDSVFISCAGADLNESVVYIDAIDSMPVKRAAMENADKIFLLLDSGKLTKRGPFRFGRLSDFTGVFCNDFPGRSAAPDNFIFT